ncbi:MAG: hypothetical protein WC637_08725 [Victivallales bacterium]|jgi:hypothetical protein
MIRKIEVSCAAFAVSAMLSAAPVATFDGQLTDKIPGWSFKPSKPKDGMTYNEFEGYYPDKGGKLISNRIKLDKEPGEAAYYRIKFDAQAPERAYQGIDFYDAKGTLLPDNYDVIYPGEKRSYDRVIYAMPKVDSFNVFFQSRSGIQAWNLSVEKTSAEEAAKYCDRIYSELPKLKFTAPEESMKLLPKTSEALKDGRPWHVLLLGDSIMQDTFHSQFHALLKREFPNSNFKFTVSMRGGTGCWHYCLADNFKKYVHDEKPDLLIIGGISNYHKDHNPTGCEAIEIVAKTAREYLDCEVLILTGALAVDTRQYDPENLSAPLPAQPWNLRQQQMIGNQGWYFDPLIGMAKKNKFAFWDMQTPNYKWLYASGKPFEFYSRDAVHSGELGKQVIGRTMMAFFMTAK